MFCMPTLYLRVTHWSRAAIFRAEAKASELNCLQAPSAVFMRMDVIGVSRRDRQHVRFGSRLCKTLTFEFRVEFLSEFLRCESQFCWQPLSRQRN